MCGAVLRNLKELMNGDDDERHYSVKTLRIKDERLARAFYNHKCQ
jgi:hypothetical protein